MHLAGVSPAEKGKILSSVLRDHGDELPQAFTVVSPEMVRVRREPRAWGQVRLIKAPVAGVGQVAHAVRRVAGLALARDVEIADWRQPIFSSLLPAPAEAVA